MRSSHSPGLIGIPLKGDSCFNIHCLLSYKDASVPKQICNFRKKKIVVRDRDGTGITLGQGRKGKRVLHVTDVHNLLYTHL